MISHRLDVVEFGEGESKHNPTVYVRHLRALLSADFVCHDAHPYLPKRYLQSWLARPDELEELAKPRVSTIYPGHDAAGNLSLISQNACPICDFATAVDSGAAKLVGHHYAGQVPAVSRTTIPDDV